MSILLVTSSTVEARRARANRLMHGVIDKPDEIVNVNLPGIEAKDNRT